MSILSFQNLSQSYADVDIFTGLDASIPHNARISLVGPNGIGKTTLLRILAGESPPSAGSVHRKKGIRIGYSQQEAMRAFSNQGNTVYAEMLTVFAGLKRQEGQLRQMEASMSQGDYSQSLLEQYGEAQEAFELAGGYDYEVRIQQVLDGLGLKRHHWHMPLSHCSGGQKTRALLARLLLEKPDLLILDEPTNHLDMVAVEWLENRLRTWEGAILIVSHDRYFLDKAASHIWEMSRNGIEEYQGNYTAYLQQRQERWARRDEEFAATKERFLKELDFIKRNIARASSSDRAKGVLRRLVRSVKAVEQGGVAALNQSWLRFNEEGPGISGEQWTVAEAEQRIKALRNPNPNQAQLKMRLQPSHRSGHIVLKAKDLVIGYPGTPLFQVKEIELYRRECVGFIGPNGAGKTTFLRSLIGDVAPLQGQIQFGASLSTSYFAQVNDRLDPDRTVLEELLSYPGANTMPVSQARNYLARFLFRGDDAFKLIGALSGGERGRMALALLALDHGNLLLLDEPSNHLDIPAQEVLQDALQHCEGTVVLVTHDRYLVDKLGTQIWELRDGHLHVHKGDYQSYLLAQEQSLERAKASRNGVPEAKDGAHVSLSEAQASKQRNREETQGVAQAVAQTEILIHKMEAVLHQLGQQLKSATVAQQWDRLPALSKEYEATQTQLDALIARWETLAPI
jgi:ATP-binding cassette subfamily F protein 3